MPRSPARVRVRTERVPFITRRAAQLLELIITEPVIETGISIGILATRAATSLRRARWEVRVHLVGPRLVEISRHSGVEYVRVTRRGLYALRQHEARARVPWWRRWTIPPLSLPAAALDRPVDPDEVTR